MTLLELIEDRQKYYEAIKQKLIFTQEFAAKLSFDAEVKLIERKLNYNIEIHHLLNDISEKAKAFAKQDAELIVTPFLLNKDTGIKFQYAGFTYTNIDGIYGYLGIDQDEVIFIYLDEGAIRRTVMANYEIQKFIFESKQKK